MNSFEQLESRAMLAGDPWQNAANPLDVTGGDGHVSPLDALAIINDLNKNGSHVLTTLASDFAGPAAQSVTAQSSSGQSSGTLYEDVNGDGMVTPLDALDVINALNSNDLVQVTLVPTDMNGVPIASIPVGSAFQLEALVADVSGNATPAVGTGLATGGVFEAEIDGAYNNTLASIDPSATIAYGTDFPNVHVGDLSTPGSIVGVGGVAGLSPLGPGQIELWSIPVTANNVLGPETFTPSYGTGVNNGLPNEIAIFGNDNAIPASQVDFEPGSVAIVSATAPLISIAPTSVVRLTSGNTNAVFTLTLANPSNTQAATVNYSTADGTAIAGTDYTEKTGTVTFPAGATTENITVSVIGSVKYNPSSTFMVDLSSPTNASIGTTEATGTITTSVAAPKFALSGPLVVSRPSTGTENAVYTVTLTGPTEAYAAVNYATSNTTLTGAAIAGTDYTSTSGQLVFPVGTTSQTITVPILGNTTTTANLLFSLVLKTPTNATITSGSGSVNITIESPSFSIVTPAAFNRPTSGTSSYPFTVNLANPSPTQATTVNFATADGTAVAGVDYTATSGTLTFPAGATSEVINVPVIGSTAYNPSTTFTVNLSSASTGATITTAQATGTINSTNPKPTLAVNTPAAVTRPTSVVFTVTLTGLTELSTTVNFATANGTAIAGTDYTNTSGILTFPAGITTENVTVPVLANSLAAASASFSLNLSGATNATINTATGTGTIVTPVGPTLSINSPSALTRPPAGNIVFTVSLANPSATQTATVAYATANGTAIAGTDYTNTSGTLTFAVGTTSQTITVPVIGTAAFDTNSTFTVNLSSPVNASIGAAQGIGTIITNNPAPTLAISSPSAITRPTSGTTPAVFTVTLTGATEVPATVHFATANGTGVAGTDYTNTSGILTFPAGTTTENITVPVIGSTAYNPSFNFTVNLTAPVNATVTTAQGTATVNSTTSPPTLAINSVSQNRPPSGTTTNEVFTVSLTGPTELGASVQFATANGTAIAGTDYTATAGTLNFTAGTTSAKITVPIIGSAAFNQSTSFTVNLTSPTGATISTAQGTGTITNVNPAPTLSITNPTVARLPAGTVNEVFTVTLTGATALPATVQYATADGTAVAGTDYTMTSGTLTFAVGTTTQNITVPVLGSSSFDGSLNYVVNLSNPTNAQPATLHGTGTITSGVAAPTLSITDPTVTKPASGTANALFTVTLTGSTNVPVTVQYATANGTAHAPGDYTSTSGTLTFGVGTTTETITVPVIGNTTFNPNETFSVNLSNQTNSTITTASATGTIVSPPLVPAISINSTQAFVGTSPTTPTNFVFTVSLSTATTAQVQVNYATADGTATVANGNYTATSGTLTFSPGTTTQNITVAVFGYTGGASSLNFFVNLTSPTNGTLGTSQGVGTAFGNFLPSSLAGKEFIDSNANGTQESGELSVQNATIRLTGTDILDDSVNLTTNTGADGSYSFGSLTPGTYTITAIQSPYLTAGQAIVGSEGGTAADANDIQVTIGAAGGVTGTGNNFTETGFASAAISERLILASNQLNGTVNLNDTNLFPTGSSASSAVSPATASSSNASSSMLLASNAAVSASSTPSVVDAAFADPQLTQNDLTLSDLGSAAASQGSGNTSSAVDQALGQSKSWLLA